MAGEHEFVEASIRRNPQTRDFGLTILAREEGWHTITNVEKGGEGDKAGLQVGDKLCEVQGKPLPWRGLYSIVSYLPPLHDVSYFAVSIKRLSEKPVRTDTVEDEIVLAPDGAHIPPPMMQVSAPLYQGTLYMVSDRWGPIEVLRRMNAWIDHSSFRCLSSNARVKALEVPLHRVRFVLPIGQRKPRFSVCLQDGSVHTFRVTGANADESAAKLHHWIAMIGQYIPPLQERIAP